MKQCIGLLLVMLAASNAMAEVKVIPLNDSDWPNKNTIEAATYRGNIVYRNYCVLCHGIKADGAGRAAKIYNPKPANLVMSDKNNDYKELIIRRGGKAIGRSPNMPPWNDELTDEQISDVIIYLETIRSPDVKIK